MDWKNDEILLAATMVRTQADPRWGPFHLLLRTADLPIQVVYEPDPLMQDPWNSPDQLAAPESAANVRMAYSPRYNTTPMSKQLS